MLQYGSNKTLLVRPDAFGMGYAQRGGEIADKTRDCNKESLAIDG
jgi:hypothetical protein